MPRTAFVSYTHESDDHKAWVLRLASDLRTGGIEAQLDRWHLRPGEEAGPFMERSVRDAEKVIVVCTETYVRKAEQRAGGTGYESSLVTAELVDNQGTAKFIPVLRNNGDGRLPSFLRGRIYIDFRDDDSYEVSLTTLLRAVHDLPAIDAPPVGEPAEALLAATPPREPPQPVRNANTALATVDEVEALLQEPHKRITLSKEIWHLGTTTRALLCDGGMFELGERPVPDRIAQAATIAEDAIGRVAQVLATMGQWAGPDQIAPAVQVVASFMDIPDAQGPFYDANRHLARYPCLLALYAAAIGALANNRHDNFHRLLFAGVPARNRDHDEPLVEALHSGAPFAQDFWRTLPGMERRHTPVSDRALEKLRLAMPALLADEREAERAFDRLEAAISMGYIDARGERNQTGWAPLGSYAWRDPGIVQRMQEELVRMGPDWPYLQAGFFGGSVDRASRGLAALLEHMYAVRNQRGIH